MQQFIVRTNNPAFDGKLAGIKFQEGRAIVNELTLDKRLGHSLEAVLLMLQKDFGHEVVEYGADGRETPWTPDPVPAQEVPPKKEAPKKRTAKK